MIKETFLPTRHQHGLSTFYEVHDISVVKNDGTVVTACVAYSANQGPLLSCVATYERVTGGDVLTLPDELLKVAGFVREVREELAEAAAYQRDLNSEKN